MTPCRRSTRESTTAKSPARACRAAARYKAATSLRGCRRATARSIARCAWFRATARSPAIHVTRARIAPASTAGSCTIGPRGVASLVTTCIASDDSSVDRAPARSPSIAKVMPNAQDPMTASVASPDSWACTRMSSAICRAGLNCPREKQTHHRPWTARSRAALEMSSNARVRAKASATSGAETTCMRVNATASSTRSSCSHRRSGAFASSVTPWRAARRASLGAPRSIARTATSTSLAAAAAGSRARSRCSASRAARSAGSPS